MNLSFTQNKVDLRHLPNEYVTKKFYDLAYQVDYYDINNAYNGGCPCCREGRSFGKKKRCWWLPDKGIIHCFNCGNTWSPLNFIKEAGGLSVSDVVKEINNGEFYITNLDKELPTKEILSVEMMELLEFKNNNLPDEAIDLSNENQLRFYKNNSVILKALEYIHSRRLDTAINKPSTFYISLTDHTHKNRLVLPFFDANGKVVFYQTRAIGANVDGHREDIRYLGKTASDKSVFNLDKISSDIEEIYVFEGPIDCCFVRNGVAIAGITKGDSDFTELQEEQLSLYLNFGHKIVWVLDNQWIDETARVKSENLLKKGEYVFIWPERLKKYKDFNDICVQNNIDEIPLSVLRQYTMSGDAGMLALMQRDIKKEEMECSSSTSPYEAIDNLDL